MSPNPSFLDRAEGAAFDTIGQHKLSHGDEILGSLLLKLHLPGARGAELMFHGNDDNLPEGPEHLHVGIGGGMFDEHRAEGRLPNTCSAVLVAEALEIADAPELQLVLNEALRADTTSGQQTMELAQMIKTLNSHGDQVKASDNPDLRVWKMAARAYLAVINQQRGDEPRELDVEQMQVPENSCLPELTKNNRAKQRIDTLILPAFCEIRALAQAKLLKWYGYEGWNMPEDSDRLEIVFVRTQRQLEREIRASDYRCIVIGIEGGQVPPTMTVRRLAKDLKVRWVKEMLRVFLRECHRWDRYGPDGYEPDDGGESPDYDSRRWVRPLELVNLVSWLNGWSKMGPVEIWDYVEEVFDAVFRESQNFWEVCPAQFKRRAFVTSFPLPESCRVRIVPEVVENIHDDEDEYDADIDGPRGLIETVSAGVKLLEGPAPEAPEQRLKICIVFTNNSVMHKYARAIEGCHVVIVRNSRRQVQLFTHRDHKMAARYAAAAISLLEHVVAEQDHDLEAQWAHICEIARTGRGRNLLGAASHWYAHDVAGSVLNGSLTHPEVPATKLDDHELVEMVLAAAAAYVGDFAALQDAQFDAASRLATGQKSSTEEEIATVHDNVADLFDYIKGLRLVMADEGDEAVTEDDTEVDEDATEVEVDLQADFDPTSDE